MTVTLTYSCYRSWLMPIALRTRVLEWNGETDGNLNFVYSPIRLHDAIEFVVTVCLDSCNKIHKWHRIFCFVVVAEKPYVNNRRLIQRKHII